MREDPLISVILPTYNRAHLLPRAINSLLNQTYQNFEIIIVNDCSPDDTEDILKSYKDSRIISYKNEVNKGVLGSINKGYDLSKGKYIALLGDDDELLPEALETLIEEFNKLNGKNIKIIWFRCIDADTGKCGISPEISRDISYKDLLCGVFEGDNWIVLDREAIKENRHDERFRFGEGFLWLEIHKKFKSHYVPKVLYKAYTQHGDRISTKSVLKDLEMKIQYKKKHLEYFGNDLKKICPKKYGKTLATLGAFQILYGNEKEGRKNLRESLKYNCSLSHIFVLTSQYMLNERQMRYIFKIYFDKY